MTQNIQDIMTENCQWGARNMTVAEAAKLMQQNDFGFLPVGCTEHDKLVGVVTDRDITTQCVATDKNPATTAISDIMTDKLYYCYSDQPVQEVCDNMAEIRVRRLPVVDRNKRLVGVVSFGDVAQAADQNEVGQTQKQLTRECCAQAQQAA